MLETRPALETNRYLTFAINALILCDDTHFLKTLERVFAKLGVNSEITGDYASALAALEQRKIDAVVVDWQEISNLGEFLETVRKSKMNKECVIIGIASDLLDLRQAFRECVRTPSRSHVPSIFRCFFLFRPSQGLLCLVTPSCRAGSGCRPERRG
jgi:hypothetical protein